MTLEEQEALLDLWMDFLADEPPTGAAARPAGAMMREFYVNVVTPSGLYRYGMAPELFDLLIHGVFDVKQAVRRFSPRRADDGHRAA